MNSGPAAPPRGSAKTRLVLCVAVLLCSGLAGSAQRIFYAPFDGSVDAVEASGSPMASVRGPVRFEPGKQGQAVRIGEGALLTYEAAGNLNKVRGTVCVWVRPDWNGDDGRNHAILSDVADFNDKSLDTLYLWKWSTGLLRLDLREPEDTYVTAPVSGWRAGEWHHVAAAWDVREGKQLYIDGQLVASRHSTWESRGWSEFHVGSDWSGASPFDGFLDDLQVYDVVLDAGQIGRVMAGKPLEVATVTRIEAPREVRVGEPLVVHAEVRVPAILHEDYVVHLDVGPAEVAVTEPYRPTTRWMPDRENIVAVATVIPEDLYLPPGEYPLVVHVYGTLPARGMKPASATITVLPPATRAAPHRWSLGPRGQVLRDGVPMLTNEQGMLWGGRYLGPDLSGREECARLLRSGRIRDALPVRLTDEVDCTTESHGFREWGHSRVIEIPDLGPFRVTAPRDSVTEKVAAYGREVAALPAFSYRLRTSGRNRPHILVVELPNDRERYTEVGIDVADGSQPGRHLMGSGFGPQQLINLAVLYTGREYPCDGQRLREALLFFPKSDEVEVIVSSSGRELDRSETSGAAVARLTLYEMTDPLRNAWNEIAEPPGPQRSVSLFYPNVPYVYTQYGFSGEGREQRLASFRAMCHYLRFVGINRFEFYPLAFGMQAYYRGGMLDDPHEYDVFEDLLPIADEEGIQLIPVLPGLAFYDQFPEWNEPERCFQLDIDGKSERTCFGKVPDPLRPQVQAKLLGFLEEFLDRCEGHSCVRAVGFKVNGKIGTCYVGTSEDDPPEEAGYAEWDIREFEKATGLRVGGQPGDAGSDYRWLRDHAWEQWINWRCEGTRDLWLKARDLAHDRGKDLIVKTILPCNHPGRFKRWWDQGQAPFDILRGHGYDWRMYERERGLRIQHCMLVDSDRYFGQWQNKAYAYDPRLIPGYRTAEGASTELYFVYWELPDHPKGFRVGPGAPPGRAFFEPITYALRTTNTYNITLYNWYRATMFREQDLREFCRAFRALPALPPRDFEGVVEPADDPRLWVKWFGDRLCVLNDTSSPQTVRLTWPRSLKKGESIFDLGRGVELARASDARARRLSLSLDLEAWDLRALEQRGAKR